MAPKRFSPGSQDLCIKTILCSAARVWESATEGMRGGAGDEARALIKPLSLVSSAARRVNNMRAVTVSHLRVFYTFCEQFSFKNATKQSKTKIVLRGLEYQRKE